MNWDAVGAIGEIVGAMAVVATLAYLAKQIRSQNQATEMAAFEGLMDGFNQLNAMLAADQALYRIFITGLNEPDELDDDEAGQFSFLLRMYMNNYDKMYRAYSRGAIENAAWNDFAAEAAEVIESPGGGLFLEGMGDADWEFINAIRGQRREQSVVDISLGRRAIKRVPP